MTANEQLNVAIVEAIAAGLTIPCSRREDHRLWTSEAAEERAEAALRCTPCPVTAECLAVAVEGHEQFGIWGSVDMSERNNQTWRTPPAVAPIPDIEGDR